MPGEIMGKPGESEGAFPGEQRGEGRGEAISLSPDLSRTLNTALDKVIEVIGVEGGAVRLVDEETGELVLAAHRGVSEETFRQGRRLKPGEGFSGLVLEKGEPMVIQHVSMDPNPASVLLRKQGYESYMVVPLRLRDKVLGTLSLFTTAERGFDTYERSLLNQVGVTLENALLYEEAARREREAAFLDRATQLFNSTLQLDFVFELVARMATEVLGESCTINLIEEGKEHLTPVAIYHPEPEARQLRLQVMRDNPIQIGDPLSVVGQAAADGRPYLIKDARREGRLKNADRLSIYSFIAVPIVSKGKILGVLATSITSPSRQFNQADLRLAMALADRAALAIENSRLYEEERELRQRMEELNRRLAESLEQLKLSQRQLLQAEKLASLGSLTTGVAHEILNPLAVISGRVQLLLLRPEVPPDLQRVYHLLLDQVDRITRICDGMLHFARQKEPRFEPVDLNASLVQTLALLESELRLRNIAVHTAVDPELPHIIADEGQLRQVFLNLLTNAMDAMPGGGNLHLATRRGEPVQVVVADTGCGIPPEHLSKIFDPFFSTKEMGTGLGLAVAHGIIQSHEGTIRVESPKGEGTTVVIELPSHT
ncbi:MAG: GAF domain-containing protein [Nitrospinae bacterium]|nr:GAF domain-containing protein [Nitrospinota bacterium]